MRFFQDMNRVGRAYALLAFSAFASASCGSGPGTPTPSSSPTPQMGGPVTGRYLARVTPAAGCAMPRTPLAFPMQAAPAGTAPHPGVQVLLVGDGSRFELEFLSTVIALRGGLGTTEEGVLANEGLRMWIRAIGAGPVLRASDGRGELVTGTLAGYLALAQADGDEGELGTCSSTEHAFSLRAQ